MQSALTADADLIRKLARVPTLVVAAARVDIAGWDGAPRLVGEIQRLPDRVSAVFLSRTDLARARAVQRRIEQAGGPPVLTGEDATAIALAAAALRYLRRLGRDAQHCRIVIADAARMPILSALLPSIGFREITLWNRADSTWFPLHRVARDADVIIDLTRTEEKRGQGHGRQDSAGGTELDLDRPEGSVIRSRALDSRILVVPGLMRALTTRPATPLGVSTYEVCARAIAQAAPTGRLLHNHPYERALSPAVAAMIADAIDTALHRAVIRTVEDQYHLPPIQFEDPLNG